MYRCPPHPSALSAPLIEPALKTQLGKKQKQMRPRAPQPGLPDREAVSLNKLSGRTEPGCCVVKASWGVLRDFFDLCVSRAFILSSLAKTPTLSRVWDGESHLGDSAGGRQSSLQASWILMEDAQEQVCGCGCASRG